MQCRRVAGRFNSVSCAPCNSLSPLRVAGTWERLGAGWAPELNADPLTPCTSISYFLQGIMAAVWGLRSAFHRKKNGTPFVNAPYECIEQAIGYVERHKSIAGSTSLSGFDGSLDIFDLPALT